MPDFKISASLEGHTDDVRAVAFPDAKSVLSASRDATVRMWNVVSSPPPTFDYRILSHGSAFINCLAYCPPRDEFPEGLIFSGGQDTMIEARQPSTPPGDSADRLLIGHSHNVCALDISPDNSWMVSGSWDSTARLWEIGGKWANEIVFDGHGGSVWAVLAYDNNTVVTGCADKLIRVFNTSGNLQNAIQGSGEVVRALCKMPEKNSTGAHFASAGNDAVIRLWTLQGRQLYQLNGHESFIYSLDVLPSGELVSAGEDRTVKVWNGDKCVQTITHPAISVWGVSVCRENGDIVSGASDRVTRVFSRAAERQADASTIEAFDESVKQSSIPQGQVGEVNKEKLPGPEFLKQKSGTKDGQVQMVREDDGSVTAHTWSSANGEWVAVGTVVDSVGSSGRNVEYMGQEYNFVFDVDIKDGEPPLKLPFNLSQNPYEVARKFIQTNELSVSYLDQVANFIITNTKGATIGSGPSQPAGDLAPTQQPSPPLPESRPKVLPQTTYLSITAANMKALQRKISEINTELVSSGSKELSLTQSEMENLSILCSKLEKSAGSLDVDFLESTLPLVLKVSTTWPVANRLPGLDLLRLLAPVPAFAEICKQGNGELIDTIISSEGILRNPFTPNNAMLAIRMFANFFETADGRDLVCTSFDQVVHQVASVALSLEAAGNRNLIIAVMTLFINFSVYLTEKSRAHTPESLHRGVILVDHLTSVLAVERDSEAVYRGLVALGTLIVGLGEQAADTAEKDHGVKKLLTKILESGFVREPRFMNVVAELREAFPPDYI